MTTDEFEITVPNFHTAVKDHLRFLKHIDNNLQVHREDVLQRAIYRYEHCWLPLLAENPDLDLEPWLDVHWVWHVHLLAPAFYAEDCTRILGKVPTHHHYDHQSQTSETARERARVLWEKKYPHEPFAVDFLFCSANQNQESADSLLTYDILSAAGRQKSFVYHVSLPHFCDNKFVASAIERYQKFVKLKKRHPRVFIVPMYDVDLVWHTHQLFHRRYVHDTTAYLGRLFPHDDSTIDRSPGSKLTLADAETRQLWHAAYGECFPSPGLMYRGEPPRGKMTKLDTQKLINIDRFVCSVVIKRVILEIVGIAGADTCWEVSSLELVIGSLDEAGNENRHVSCGEPVNEGGLFVWSSGKGLYLTKVTSAKMSCIQSFSVFQPVPGGDSTVIPLFQQIIDLASFEQEIPGFQFGSEFTVNYQLDDKTNIGILLEFGEVEQQAVDVRLEMGEFHHEVLSSDFEDVWGPIALHRLPDHAEDDWIRATHRLTLVECPEEFACKVIHSASLAMTAVQLVHAGNIVAVSHLIGPEQLPHPSQLGTPGQWITLDPRRGQRAMLIKTTCGDWAVLVGRWVSSASTQDAGSCSAGHFVVTVYGLVIRKKQTVTIGQCGHVSGPDDEEEKFTVNLENVSFNMKTGEVKIKQVDGKFLAENLVLVLSVAALFIVCLPDNEPSYLQSLLMAKWAGLGRLIPSNVLLNKRRQSSRS